MPTEVPRMFVEIQYHRAAQDYLGKLPLRHFMEATPQATQRAITLACLALLCVHRADVHVFNELLVQYPLRRRRKLGQVVPDNMVVIHPGSIKAEGSYDLPLQPSAPFWVIEYVPKSRERKDYVESMRKYEDELKVPYYLVFYPDHQELSLFHHNGTKYVSVPPNEQGRHPIPELELELALLDGWVRFWFRGELLPLPGELLRQRDEERQGRLAAEAELTRLRQEVERLRGQSTGSE
jgi:hypothetical protein